MTIVFSINYHTNWGQRLLVSGSLPELGKNTPAKAVPMEYVSNGEWRLVLNVKKATSFNYKYLIFDEATAAVDSETEHLIQEAIERLIRGRTTLMIAHRLSTLRNANKIVVVDKGEIIEFGTPDELMAKQGKYYKLIQIQSMGEQLKAQKEAENFE